jgi:hypothetical protein
VSLFLRVLNFIKRYKCFDYQNQLFSIKKKEETLEGVKNSNANKRTQREMCTIGEKAQE